MSRTARLPATVTVAALALVPAVVLALVLGGVPGAWAQQQDRQQPPEPYGVVSLEVTYQHADPVLPWNKGTEQTIRGNAIVVEGQRLLTTADMVKDANLIQVRKFARYPDFAARIALVDYEMNLALLEVDDPDFWQGLRPLPLAEAPVVSGRFTINRWRANGRFEQGSGEVVDVRATTSPFGSIEFPVLRGNTTMSGLGWAEALTHEGAVVGLLTSSNDSQLQATPSDVLRLFVQAAGSEPYRGFAHRGFSWQRLNQRHLRAYFGLAGDGTGVLVRSLFPGGTGADTLRSGDILHRLGPYPIDPEGYIDHPVYGAIEFTLAINESAGPTISAEIERDGERMTVELQRARFSREHYRVPPPMFDKAPDYEVFGGLVLRELTLNYLRAWGGEWRTKAPTRLVMEYEMHGLREQGEPPEKVVFISRVLPDPSNLGYDDVANTMVQRVNGEPVHSLEDFRAAVRQAPDGFHVVDLLPGQSRAHLVYDAGAMARINERVARRYDVPAP